MRSRHRSCLARVVLAGALAGCVAPVAGTGADNTAPDAGIVEQPDATSGAAHGPCPNPGAVTNRGALPVALAETSGIVASRAQPGILYAHNDAGDSARVFAVDDHGAQAAEILVGGASNVDWEDIAIGPCPAGTCVYVGDIGDNELSSTSHTIYRFPEPNLTPGTNAGVVNVTAEKLAFNYPGGIKPNAETLLVHPITGDAYVVTKTDPGVPATVYKLPTPFDPSATATLAKVASLPYPSGSDPDISGGDINASGTGFLLRLGSARLYMLEPTSATTTAVDAAFAASVSSLPIANETNGEAITWAADGNGYFTASEGAGAELHYIACQ